MCLLSSKFYLPYHPQPALCNSGASAKLRSLKKGLMYVHITHGVALCYRSNSGEQNVDSLWAGVSMTLSGAQPSVHLKRTSSNAPVC